MFGPISSVYYERINQGDLQEDPPQSLLLSKLDHLYEQLHKPFWYQYFHSEKKGLYIVGDVGRGKTYLMDLFYDRATISKQRLHYHIFIKTIHDSLLKYQPPPWESLGKEFYKKGALLCLDEFQLNDMGDLMILFQFFKHFFSLGGILITTSNRQPDEFHLPNDLRCRQFLKFLLQHLEIFSLEKGPDYRLKGKETCRRVFVDKRVVSVANFFQRSAQKDLKECTYSFHTLCETPVGVAYYDSILKECGSIIITDFKQLNDAQENSLIRFMQLIDLLYETKTSLFMYTDFLLKDIYIGSKYKEPFRRTLSRLYEITSR
jgi:cell division protein ZapE